MTLRLIDAITLHGIVSQLNISSLNDDKEKLTLIRLNIELKKYSQHWHEFIESAKTMHPDSVQSLVEEESKTEIEIPDTLLIPVASLEQLALSNAAILPAGSLATLLSTLTPSD